MQNIREKINPHTNRAVRFVKIFALDMVWVVKPTLNKILGILLLLGIAFSVITIVNAVAPNPGHNFTEVSGSIATGNLIYGSAADTFAALASVAAGSYLRSAGVSTAPVWSTLTLPNAGTTGDILFASATNVIGNLADVAVGRFLVSGGVGVAPLYSATPTLGVAGATLGTLSLSGNTSGVITIQPQAAAGTYNFNLPTGAGTAGQPLLSGGGVGAAMTFGTLTVGAGGTGLAATADDAVFVGDSASAVTARALPSCSGATTDKLLYNISTNTFSCGVDQTGAGGSPTPEATYTMFSTGRVMLADGLIMDLFNAVGSGKIIRITGVFTFQRTTAVTGIVAPVELKRITAVGTGGTAISAGNFDPNDAALPAQITASTLPTGGATQSGNILAGSRILTEEASLGTGAAGSFPWFQSQAPIYVNRGNTSAQRLTLREGQGIVCKWGVIAGTAAGLVACGVTFQVGAASATEVPTYSWQSNSAATASKKMIDIFNATGSLKILKITRINVYARPTAAVAGTIIPFEVYRTSAVGTGGTTITADTYDTTNAAVPAQITARDGPTAGATLSGGVLISSMLGTDETTYGNYYGDFRRAGVALNTPYVFDGSTTERPLTVREGQGITIQTGPLSGVGNVVIIVEGTLQ